MLVTQIIKISIHLIVNYEIRNFRVLKLSPIFSGFYTKIKIRITKERFNKQCKGIPGWDSDPINPFKSKTNLDTSTIESVNFFQKRKKIQKYILGSVYT